MKIGDARKLTLQQKELIRRQAVSLVIDQGISRRKSAQLLGVSFYSVQKWLSKYSEEGDLSLKNKKHGRPAKTISKLKPWQCATIVKIISDKTPDQLKMPFMLWNINSVKELIANKFNIRLSTPTISRYLKRWGFTPQRPLTRSFSKDPKKVTKFLIEEYPLIKKRAKKENGEIHFLDEMGINNNTHSFIRGYAKKGKDNQPVMTRSAKRVSSNMVSTINNSGHFRFMVYEENMNVAVFLKFLNQLIKKQDKKIFLILDNLKVHKAYKVQDWQRKNKDKIEFFFLPPYSPELNPDELVNQDVKANALKHKLIHKVEDLNKNLRSYLYSLQKNKQKIKNFFLKECVKYAA